MSLQEHWPLGHYNPIRIRAIEGPTKSSLLITSVEWEQIFHELETEQLYNLKAYIQNQQPTVYLAVKYHGISS